MLQHSEKNRDKFDKKFDWPAWREKVSMDDSVLRRAMREMDGAKALLAHLSGFFEFFGKKIQEARKSEKIFCCGIYAYGFHSSLNKHEEAINTPFALCFTGEISYLCFTGSQKYF